MRLLADENFPGPAVEALRRHGHDVTWVRTDAPGSSDLEVMTQARAGNRLIITFDKDFGDLVFLYRVPVPPGVILFRLPTSSSNEVAAIAVAALASREDWAGNFSVVEDDRIRIVPLPEFEI